MSHYPGTPGFLGRLRQPGEHWVVGRGRWRVALWAFELLPGWWKLWRRPLLSWVPYGEGRWGFLYLWPLGLTLRIGHSKDELCG